jgi:hypothetical protein
MEAENSSSVFSPELLGPVFKIENITLQQVRRNLIIHEKSEYFKS